MSKALSPCGLQAAFTLVETLLVAEKRLNLTNLMEPQIDNNEGSTVGWNSDTIRKTAEALKKITPKDK